MSKSKITPIGRASFPHLDKPNMYGKYAVTMLLKKSDPKVKEFVAWLGQTVHDEALAIAGEKGMQSAIAGFLAFKDGDNDAMFKTPRAENAGNWVLTLSRKSDFGKPCLVNRHRQSIDASEIYSGCDILAYIDVFGYNFNGKKGVSIGVQHIMKVSENTPFTGGGVTAENAFGDLDLPEENKMAGIDTNPFGNTSPVQPTARTQQTRETYNPFAGV